MPEPKKSVQIDRAPLNYLQKMSGGLDSPPDISYREALISGLGGLLAIAAAGWLSDQGNLLWLMAPFGGTCVLAFAAHKSPFAQPRSILGGHLISTAIGLVLQWLVGSSWWSMGLAVGLCIAAMLVTNTVHPPAGANPLVVMAAPLNWSFLLQPVLTGSVAIIIIALLFNNLLPQRQYPRYW